jgi:glutathione S-transferase
MYLRCCVAAWRFGWGGGSGRLNPAGETAKACGAAPEARSDCVTTYRLYGSLNSGHSYKVRMALLLLGIEHEYRAIDIARPREARDPEWQRLSRFGEVPVLVADGRPIVQSNAILLHLARAHQALGWQQDQDRLTEWLFWEANRIGFSLPNFRFHSLFGERHPPDAMALLETRMKADMAALEDALGADPFLMGEIVSAADLSCAAYLLYEDVLDTCPYPNVRAWLDRIRALPGWIAPRQAMA